MNKNRRTKRTKRIGAALLAASMIVSAFGGSFIVQASDSWPNEKASAEPSFAGYRVKDIKNWSPETDPYAEFLRAEVPLQTRNEAFQATQAKPYLASDAQVMLMQGDYGNSFFNSTMYTDKFGEHVLNFWQYADYFSPWHGAATAYTPESIYDPVTSDWRARGFEFGVVNIPNPAYTNAAHKNGVMSIACIYFDPAFRPGQTCADLIEKDENGYSIADKLIEMAKYMGFDGYFLNQEEGYYADFKPFMAKLTKAGLYTQWYDTNSYFNSSKAQWLKDDTNGQINNSVFINYGWTGGVDSSLDYAKQIGVDPFETLFFGLECNQNKFNGGHSSAKNITNLYDNTGNPRASVALFTPSDWYQRGVDEVPFYDGKSTPPMQRDEFQWMVAERERMFFSGVMEDPTNTGLKPGYKRTDVQVTDASGWVGVADFIAERSVIDGTKFYTNFNTGHGMQYFVEGKVSADKAWTNINIQDILPTWQWWVESTNINKLSVDFDYGDKLVNHNTANQPITLPYTQVGAYNGGSSLVVYGNINASNSLHLYKTDLDVNENSKASITFKKTSDDAVTMQLGLIFKDAPQTTEKLDIAGSETAGDWTTVDVDLSKYAGRKIAAITLEFAGNSENYQMNVGGLKVSDGADKPATPTGFTVDYGYDSGEMILSWDMADYSKVKQYNVYGTLSNGDRVYLGGVYDSILYVKSVFDEKDHIDLELRAVGADGTESDPATLTYTYTDKVSNVKVEEAKTSTGLLVRAATPGKLVVSFDAPKAGAPDSYEYEVTLRNIAKNDPDNQVYTYTTEGNVTSAEVPLPVKEGYEYDLKIYSVRDGQKGEAICYRGWSNDSYSEPIAKEDIRISGTSVRLVDPDSVDWYTLTAEFNGRQVANFKRGAASGNSMRFTISGDGLLSVVTGDFAGNKSEPTVVMIEGGQVVDPSNLISEKEFPDAALLKAVQEQVGLTLDALEKFNGTLDLSGTQVSDLTGLNRLTGMTGIDFSDCTALTEISGLDKCTNLKEVNISGCTALEKLDLSGLGLEKLDASGEYANIKSVDISNNKLDLSEGTPEREFVEAALAATAGAETPSGKVENLVPGATVIGSDNISEASKFVDGDTGTDTAAADRNKSASVTLDLGAEKNIGSWSVWIKTNSDAVFRPFGVKTAELAVADTANGEYKTVSTLETVPAGTPDTLSETVAKLDAPVTARYVKITVTAWQPHPQGGADWPAMVEAMVYSSGDSVEAVKYDNQRPAVYSGVYFLPTEEVKMEVSAEGTVDVMSYVEKAYTARGNEYAGLKDQLINGKSFLADDVDVNAKPDETFTASVMDQNRKPVEGTVLSLAENITYKVTYKNEENETAGTLTIVVGDGGEMTTPVVITENPTILYATEQGDHNPSEDPEKAFDKDETTKWCPGGNAVQAQMVIDVGAYYTLTEWNMSHAGVNISDGSGRNTRDFALQVLNVPNPTAEQLADKDFLTNDANWTTVASYKNNQENRTHYEFTESVTGRYFRLNVTKGDTSVQWPSTRIYEWSMKGVLDKAPQPTPVEKTELQQAITNAAQYEEAKYTEATWAAFAAALAKANEVNNNAQATQEQVNEAVKALNAAIAALEERPTVSKTELAQAIADAAQYEESKYTEATWAAFADALAKANEVNGNAEATQDQVNEATKALNDAIAALEERPVINKTELEQAIADAAQYEEAKYTEATWMVFADALAKANEVNGNAEATQEQVNEATKALNDAIAALEEYVAPDKSLLETTYEYAKTLSTEGVTDAAKEYFQKVMTVAEAVLKDSKATEDEVNTAWRNLLDGIAGLGVVQGDKTNLKQLISVADEMMKNVDKYVETNWPQLVEALAEAKVVDASGNALDEDIQPACEKLLHAIMIQRYKANKANLEELIQKAEAIDLSKYTEESVAAFRTALYNANLVLMDETLSEDDQPVVDKAYDELAAAIENLSTNESVTDPDDGKGDTTTKPDDGKGDTTTKPDDGKGDATTKPDGGKTPATGDQAPWMVFPLLAAGLCLCMTVVLRRRMNAEK